MLIFHPSKTFKAKINNRFLILINSLAKFHFYNFIMLSQNCVYLFLIITYLCNTDRWNDFREKCFIFNL